MTYQEFVNFKLNVSFSTFWKITMFDTDATLSCIGFPNSIKAEVEECSPDKSPTPSSMPSSRSPSPVSAVQHRGSSLASSLGCQHGTSSCSQPDSPAISSLTSPRESASEEKSSIGTHYRRDHDMKQEAHKRPRTGRSPPRIDGETAADA